MKEKWIKVTAVENNEIIEISFTDSGNGIQDPKILANLMSPFFSTKEVGKGVGIGLAIVKGVVSKHNGEFYLNMQEKNTQFLLKLPKFQKKNLVNKLTT